MPVVVPSYAPTADNLARLDTVLAQVHEAIAPVWPLDRSIAVNPLWGHVDRPLHEVAARWASLSGAQLSMSRSWYRAQWAAGRFGRAHVEEALRRSGPSVPVQRIVEAVRQDAPQLPVRHRLTEVLDSTRDTGREMPWSAFVVDRISMLCADWYADAAPADGLYARWRAHATADRGPRLLMGRPGLRRKVAALPTDPVLAVVAALEVLDVPEAHWVDYLTALLLDVQGWAGVAAHRRFEARQRGGDDTGLTELLAIRIGWDRVLLETGDAALVEAWAEAKAHWTVCDALARAGRVEDWVLQRAFEIATHAPLVDALRAPPRTPSAHRPDVQAAFCIDVRSEVYRRGLEAQSDTVQTLGFAGFFGLPAVYRAVGSDHDRAQLPGPLVPSVRVEDTGVGAALGERRRRREAVRGAWKRFGHTALSGFSFVEATGMAYGPRLVSDALGWTRPTPHPERAGLTAAEHARRRPRLVSTVDGEPLGLAARVDLAAGILRGLGLVRSLARLVVLVGHGSQTVNNPHAAGLDCGACCGQSGEVNARAVAALLNEPAVRSGLAARGLEVPHDTWFLPGHHDTTTDDVALFDLDGLPRGHEADLRRLQAWLADAGAATRRARAPSLGLSGLPSERIDRAVRRRATDWSQVRPEWGLAGNHAFVVAPRDRTRGLDLGGRVFLHDYRWQDDDGFGVLEGLLTAPMVVTHWINFQYYASTVDNRRFGSGNKVLHNVVGPGLGVFEGNGGDLRPGLALQSLHDGERWVHEPVRLGVFVQAPREAIEGVLEAHDTVRHLVGHGWVHLHQVDDEGGVAAWTGRDWLAL